MSYVVELKNARARLKRLGTEYTITSTGRFVPILTTDSNIEIADGYINYLVRQGEDVIKKTSICNMIDSMVFLLTNTDFELSSISESDIDDYLTMLETYISNRGKPLSEKSKATRKMHLRDFLKYMKKDELLSMLKVRNPRSQRKLPENLLTIEDVYTLIEHESTARDRAFIATLYESGARIGEIMSCLIYHVEFDSEGLAHIQFPSGKTGSRRVKLVMAASYLRQWIDAHPLKDDPNAALWVSLDKNIKPIKKQAMSDKIKRVAKKAGIKKPVNPHHFRHSRATHLANHLTEQQMKQHLGWTPGSNMPEIYVHLSGRDTDNAIDAMYGIKKLEEQVDPSKPVRCPRCKEYNKKDKKHRFCIKCGYGLDEKAQQEKDNTIDEMISIILKSPEIHELYERKKAELKQ
ncbi:tyrosine-type recombinase/integrase [Methanolobus sediminis]|uniref:Tyrosine-type recombinase/integrase n=1 Tax=Methanolobus sediminis TaxID=3072978 RepID=A0AA51UJJ3_9EURY|nr:tyrosine-type recombinase/integrase [Methanolobus sediminis]WMW24699.1 tyrosine-type recombinase/integrase [Methanolobus sediminis]